MATYEEIKKHWDSLGESEKESHTASWNDKYMMQKEMIEISKHIRDADTWICDIGCNNGYCDFKLLELFNHIHIRGVDYSEPLIAQANATLSRSAYTKRCEFSVGDILNVASYPPGPYNIVLLKRVLINLKSEEDQMFAITNVKKLLTNFGRIILTEAVEENWARLNRLRREFGLEELKQSWHNRYLSQKVVDHFYANFNVDVDEDYSSAYYIGSRVLHPWLKKLLGEESWKYESEINRLASMLPNIGDYGTQRLFVLSPKK